MTKRSAFLHHHTISNNNPSLLLQWNCWTSILSLSRFGAMTDDWLELITCFELSIQAERDQSISHHNRNENNNRFWNGEGNGERIREWKGYWLCDHRDCYPFTFAQQRHVLDHQTQVEMGSTISSNMNNMNTIMNLPASDQCWITIETILSHCEGIVYKKAAMNLLFFITKNDHFQSSFGAIVAGLCLAFCNGKDNLSIKLSKSLVKDLVKRGTEPSLPCILICLVVCMNERVSGGR